MYGIFPPVFEKPMCLASGVVLCPVLLCGSTIPPPRCSSIPLPPSFSGGCSCSVPKFPLPSAGPGACVHRIPARPPCPFVFPALLVVLVLASSRAWAVKGTALLGIRGVSHLHLPFLPHLGVVISVGDALALHSCPLQLKGNQSCALLWRTTGCARAIGGSGCDACFNKCLSYKCAVLLKWFHL